MSPEDHQPEETQGLDLLAHLVAGASIPSSVLNLSHTYERMQKLFVLECNPIVISGTTKSLAAFHSSLIPAAHLCPR